MKLSPVGAGIAKSVIQVHHVDIEMGEVAELIGLVLWFSVQQ